MTGGASRRGILVKGSNYLEALAETEIVVFDKTGTLTKGIFQVQQILPEGISADELLEIAAYAESYSNHPISLSLQKAYGKAIDAARISGVEETSGHGVTAQVDGKTVAAGNAKLMRRLGIAFTEPENAIGTVVHVAQDGVSRIDPDCGRGQRGREARDLRTQRSRHSPDGHAHGRRKPTGERVSGELGWIGSTPSCCPRTRWRR